MQGHVSEWVRDWHDGGYYRAGVNVERPGSAGGTLRVMRGGSWDYGAAGARSASGYSMGPGTRGAYDGFRLVRSSCLLLS
jgi:sulfatase modifying factor 1